MGAEFTLQMMATSDAGTCLRRGWCQPVGGFSVVSALGVAGSQQQLRAVPEVVAVLASVDSASLFQTRSPGAVSDMSGTVALMAAFDSLAAWNREHRAVRPAVFHWFTAEAWGYSGSKAFAKALREGQAPYNESALWAVLEAKQVGTKGAPHTLYAHVERGQEGANNAALSAVLGAAQAAGVGVERATVGRVPPSSTTTFLQGGRSVPHCVVADHDATYRNRYYHSMYDDLDNVDVDLVCKAATLLANAVATLQGFAQPQLQVNCSTVVDLMACLAGSWNCPQFAQSFPGQSFQEYPGNYAGVWNGWSMTYPVKYVQDWAAVRSALANAAAPAPSPCAQIGAPCNNNTGRCIRNQCYDLSLTWYAPAVSPVFYWDGHWRVRNDSAADAALPVFVESNWNALQVRTFHQEHPAAQLGGLVAGVALTLFATVVCVVATRKFNAVWRVE